MQHLFCVCVRMFGTLFCGKALVDWYDVAEREMQRFALKMLILPAPPLMKGKKLIKEDKVQGIISNEAFSLSADEKSTSWISL